MGDVISAYGDCWFCGEHTALIAGHDEWNEQRLCCDRCDERLRAIAAHRFLIVHRDRESFRLCPAASQALDVERLARELAFQLYDAAPPKIEGGSPARQQWIADILAVQIATQVDSTLASAFHAAMNGDDARLTAEEQGS